MNTKLENEIASILWLDRETLSYISGKERVKVWVDYEPGFFSRGRIVHANSIQSWISEDGELIRPVSEEEQAIIISAIVEHFKSEQHPCRVER